MCAFHYYKRFERSEFCSRMWRFQMTLITLAPFLLVSYIISLRVHGEEFKAQDGGKYYSLLIPNVQPDKQDINLCTAFQTPNDDYEYIVQFTPNTSMHSKNHMLLYGCEVPGRMQEGNPRTVWDCGDSSGPKSDIYPDDPVCSSGTRVLYSWSKEASPLSLPEGVGFKIGKGTGINYLVLKVYYADIENLQNGDTDNAGFTIKVLPSTTNSITKKAGLYLLSTGGVIRSGEEEHFESACRIEKPVDMHPFAFRPHAHALGKIDSAYKIDKDGNWHLIAKGNPQLPQKFYPIKGFKPVIHQGDIVAARCTMYNFRDRDTYIGPTDHDEMCMFYMMYYVNGDQPLAKPGCDSNGPPSYYWSKDPKLPPIPSYIDKEASKLD